MLQSSTEFRWVLLVFDRTCAAAWSVGRRFRGARRREDVEPDWCGQRCCRAVDSNLCKK